MEPLLLDTPYKGKDTRTAYLTVPNVDFCIFTIHIEPLKDRTTILVTGPKVSFIYTFHCTKYLIIYPSVGGGLYSNHLCLSVIRYAPKILRFMNEAIWQWKDHLLFCKQYIGIVVKPFRFREKAVRRHFRSLFLVICHNGFYCDSLQSCLLLIDVVFLLTLQIYFEPNLAGRFF